MTIEELAARIDRLESLEHIRALAADYAKLIDAKDLDAVADLFTEDTAVGTETGRAAKLRSLVRHHGGPGRFGTTVHLIAGHSINLDTVNPARASGVLYCRAEHEIGELWVVATIQYWDRYAKVAGRWLFAARDVKAFSVVDLLERPNGQPVKHRLTHFGLLETAELPAAWPTWNAFWQRERRDPRIPAPERAADLGTSWFW